METGLEPHQQPKPIFKSLRLLSLNQTVQFCCVFNESVVGYLAGRSLVVENTKTQEQIILWVADSGLRVLAAAKTEVVFGSVKIALLVQHEEESMFALVAFSVDSNNFFYKKRDERTMRVANLLKDEAIALMEFSPNAESIFLHVQGPQESSLKIYQLSTGIQICHKPLSQPLSLMKSCQHKKQCFVALVTHTKIVICGLMGLFIRDVTALHAILDENQKVWQVQFVENQAVQLLGFALTSLGRLIIFDVKNAQFLNLTAIDLNCEPRTMAVNQPNLPSKQPAKSLTTIRFIEPTSSSSRTISPTCFKVINNRVILAYENSRKLLYLTYSLVDYSNYSATSTEDEIFWPGSSGPPQSRVLALELSPNMCLGGLVVRDQAGHLYLCMVDVLRTLMDRDELHPSRLPLCGNYGCRGLVKSVCFSARESCMFMLYETGEGRTGLAYYELNGDEVKDRPSDRIKLWDEVLKNRISRVSLHPINYTVMLISEQNVKLHHYNREKMFQNHAFFLLSHCQVGSFSPLGDKIVLGNINGLFVIDSYTLEISHVLNPAPGKIPRRLAFCTPFDILIDCQSSNTCSFVEINNYTSTSLLGQVTLPSSELTAWRSASAFTTMEADMKREIIIVVVPGRQLRFYSMDMELMNCLSVEPTCILLNLDIEILVVGTIRGSILLFKWPEIVHKMSDIHALDPEVIALHNVHQDRIVSVQMSANFRHLFVASESTEINVLEFMHENATNISKFGSLMIMKKACLRPIVGNCIASTVDENKRSEAIVKSMGKQADVYKKNEELGDEMKSKIDSAIEDSKAKTQQKIKDQIDESEEEKVIRGLMRKIQATKNELLDINHKKKREKKSIQDEFQQQIRKIFDIKNKLEEEFRGKNSKYEQERAKFLEKINKQKADNDFTQNQQIELIEKGLWGNNLACQRMKKIDNAELLYQDEDHKQNMQLLKMQLEEELQELREQRNQLQVSIRKHNIGISELNNKNSDLGMHFTVLQGEFAALSKQLPQRDEHRQRLHQRLLQIKKRKEALIIEERTLQFEVGKAQKKTDNLEQYFQKLQLQVKELAQKLQETSSKKIQLDDRFFQENRKSIYLNETIQSNRKKIEELKIQRNKAKQKSAITQSKKLSRSLHSLPKFSRRGSGASEGKDERVQNVNPSSQMDFIRDSESEFNFDQQQAQCDRGQAQYDSLLFRRDDACERLDKLNLMKNEKIKKSKQLNIRLINDHKRLILQLNELRRFNEILVKKQRKLKDQIKQGSLMLPAKIAADRAEAKNGPTLQSPKPKAILRKSGFVSLHQNGQASTPGNYITEP